MRNKPAVAPADLKKDDRGQPALTKRFYGFNSQLVLGPVIPELEWSLLAW